MGICSAVFERVSNSHLHLFSLLSSFVDSNCCHLALRATYRHFLIAKLNDESKCCGSAIALITDELNQNLTMILVRLRELSKMARESGALRSIASPMFEIRKRRFKQRLLSSTVVMTI